MQITKFNKEVCAWSIAIIMGLTTFLVQSGRQKTPDKKEESKSQVESIHPEKYSSSRLDTELTTTAIVVDNSISN